jgi:phosphatidylinositol alpha-1,6-mannosyltransferase
VTSTPCRAVPGAAIVFLEASSTGLPVIVGDSGGAPDAVRDGETGYLVDGRDLGTLADRLSTLLTDRDLARRMGAAGRAWVEAEWRWDTQADRMAALLAGAGGAAPAS